MEPEYKEILKKTLELSQDNNKMLQSMHRSLVWGRVFRFIYWIVLLGIAIGSFYYIQPYLDQVLGTYQGVKGQLNSLGSSL